MPSDDLRDVTRRALDDGAAKLRALELSRPAQAVAPLVMKALRRRDYDGVLSGVTRLRDDLRRIDAVLKDVQDQVSRAESERAGRRPFGEAWSNMRLRQVQRARRDGDLPAMTDAWVGTWAEALAANELDLCKQISRWVDDQQQLASGMAGVTAALETGALTVALAELDPMLTDIGERLGTETSVLLLALRARLLLGTRGDVVSAVLAADEAIADAESGHAEPDVRALALTVRAQVDLASADQDGWGDLASARALVDQARRLEPSLADPFVVAGLLAELEGAWLDADKCYAEAFRLEQKAVTTGRLLRPVPANLYWLAAREMRDSDPEYALFAVESALAIGVTGEGEFVTCTAMLDKAGILKRLDRSREAAETYADAGISYIQADAVARGAEVLDRACALAPDVAEYRWHYAEALRTLALDADWVVDHEVMRRAKEQLDIGLGLADPDEKHPWVQITAAMIADSMDDPAVDPVLLIERALLLDDQYVAGYRFLSMLLTERGFAEAAYEAAEHAYQLEPFDLFTTRQIVGALANLGRYEEGLEIVDRYLWAEPDDIDALCDRCWMLLRLGDPRAALETLRNVERTDRSQSMLALCRTAVGDEEGALTEYRKLWEGQLPGIGRQGLAWSAYRLGLLDEAIRIVADMTARMPSNASFACDLGQMRLVRGNSAYDDLAEGKRILRQGIETTYLADYLSHLVDLEFPVARRAVHTRHHREEVERTLDEMAALARRRHLELRSPLRPTGPGATAAAGRIALRRNEAEPALAAYRGLVESGGVPEAVRGLRAAVLLAFEQGDALAISGDLPEAKKLWNRIRPALRWLPDTERVVGELAARLAVAELSVRSLRILLRQPDAEEMLAQALEVFARDGASVWNRHDELIRLAEDPALTGKEREVLGRVAKRLPLDRAYRLRRELVPDEVIFPVVIPLEVRFGADLEHLRLDPETAPVVSRLRTRLTEEMGIEIPGIKLTDSSDLPADGVEFLVHEQLAGSLSVDPEESGKVFTVLEQVVRENLFRMLTVDDIWLWLQEWGGADAGGEELDDHARIRLCRVLRMLLREGVPIRDRQAILDGFHDAAGGLLDAVRSVRLRLGASVLRGSATVHPIPDVLQDRLLIALDPAAGTAWEADRSETVELIRELRSWLAGLPEGPRVVSVREPRVRPFTWRLLAAERPTVTVLAEEEVS